MSASVNARSEPGPSALQKTFAVFLGLHGVVHIIGFIVPWRLGTFRDMTYHTTIVNGAFDVGDVGIKLLGLGWLAVTIAMVLVPVMIWRQMRSAYPATLAVVLASLLLCATGVPGAIAGLLIDAIILPILVFFPAVLIPRPIRG